MANKIQFKRGLKEQIPILNYGEPGFVSDEKELYIGTETGNIKLTSKSEIKNLTSQLDKNKKHTEGYVNVFEYECVTPTCKGNCGAIKGNGIHDDTLGIQNLIDTNDMLYFPKGTYLITSPLNFTKKCYITGFNKLCTKFKTNNDINMINVKTSLLDIEKITFEGFYSTNMNELKGVCLNATHGLLTVKDCRINYFGSSIVANDIGLSVFDRIIFYGFKTCFKSEINSNLITITNCSITRGIDVFLIGEGRNTDIINTHIEEITGNVVTCYDEGTINIDKCYLEAIAGYIIYAKNNPTPAKYKGYKELITFKNSSVYNNTTNSMFRVDTETVLIIKGNELVNNQYSKLIEDNSTNKSNIYLDPNQVHSDPYSASAVVPSIIETVKSPFGILENLYISKDTEIKQPKLLNISDKTLTITIDTFVPVLIYCEWLSNGHAITINNKEGYTIIDNVINSNITKPTIYMLVWRGYDTRTYRGKLVKILG